MCLSFEVFFHSHNATTSNAKNNRNTSATVLYQTVHLNESKNRLFSYDSLGCWNTNLERVGVGLAMYSSIDIRSDVKNIGDPEREIEDRLKQSR